MPFFSYSQKIGRFPATIYLQDLNNYTNDGMLIFEIDVRMADCIDYLELSDFDKISKKKNILDKIHDFFWFKILKNYNFENYNKFKREITEENYFLKDLGDNQEHIIMKCELINLKSLFGRKKTKKRLQINIFSKSSRIIYSKVFILNKLKILELKEVRLGVEPS